MKIIKMKQIIYLNIILLLLSCNTNKINNTMNKNSLEYKAFMAKENRFEINGCTLKYNDKSFKLGMTIKEIESVFGKNDKIHDVIDFIRNRNEKRLLWKDKNIEIAFVNDKCIYIYIYIGKGEYKILEEKYSMDFKGLPSIMYNNSILYKGEKMQDFIKKSNLEFTDFIIDTDGYRDVKNCTNEKTRVHLSSSVLYNRIGGGHLYVRGDWKLDETYPIEAISISYIDD